MSRPEPRAELAHQGKLGWVLPPAEALTNGLNGYKLFPLSTHLLVSEVG